MHTHKRTHVRTHKRTHTNRRFEQDGTAEACAPHNVGANGIGLLAYGALAGGTLSGKYADAEAAGQV